VVFFVVARLTVSNYTIYENYRDDEALRNRFFDFVEDVFQGADFRLWFQKGQWSDDYIPFSIVKDDKIVSNVSITRMKILIDGQSVNGIQFGTVGTIPAFRKQGLSRSLMEYVLTRYECSSDIFFLFANESVLDFYTKFGFIKYSEAVFLSESNIPRSADSARKLDIHQEIDAILVQDFLRGRLVLTSVFGALDYGFITWWHILNVFSDNLYYVKDDNVIFIITQRETELHVWDAIFTKPIDISAAIPKIIPRGGVESIHYHFPPDQLNFKYDRVKIDGATHLFVRGAFAIGDRSFKFPTTAET
jgi:predicted N-acetyltransferase YhbS